MTTICTVLVFLSSYVLCATSSLCTNSNIDTVARVVFGEARGEPQRGQLAVAYTIVNRIAHSGYPSTILRVVYAKYMHGTLEFHQYNTLDDAGHTAAWQTAKAKHSATYNNAVKAASDALCRRESDPTGCATDYCAYDPCSATNDNCYYIATRKIQIGRHYFVCRVAAR